MKSWSIGEVARVLGVKTHVIRYWESEVPLLSPPKGLSGRREYSANQIRLLLRFRHLLYDRKFTIEGAKQRMWEELGAGDPDLAARFAAVRADLIDALMKCAGYRAGMTVRRGYSARGSPGQTDGEDMNDRELMDRLDGLGQEHLFASWAARPEPLRRRLREDLGKLDLSLFRELRSRLAADEGRSAVTPPSPAPAPYVSLAESRGDREAREAGEERIRRGRTAFLTVAGGHGSRLGFEGPKGMVPVTPIRRLTLFALFAEKLLAARRWYGVEIPWLIMTGPQNHGATTRYFEKENWFGLGSGSVRLFSQGILPSLSPDGGLLMGPDGGLLFNPNGHGGVIEALRRSDSLASMEERGVEQLFYFQVDNPLVRVPDPVFLGFHCRRGARISSKVVPKAYPEEKLGVIAMADGAPMVIEYSDLDDQLMRARGPDGRLLFLQGSIAIHIIDVAFAAEPRLRLPWHIARKKVRSLNPTPTGTEILERDAVKMEMFVFDAIPFDERALFFETERAEEFAPLKNRDGLDSIETCTRGQVEQAARWLAACGVEVPRDAQGRPRHAMEISPLFAFDPAILAARRGMLKDRIDEDTLLA